MFVAIARLPETTDRLDRLAALTGLARPDAARLLAGTFPKVILRSAPDGPRIVAELEAAGFVAFAGEPAGIRTDRDRVVARQFAFSPEGLTVMDGRGQSFSCPASAIAALLRGVRQTESSETVTTTERKLGLGKAILTSGLMVTKKVETTSERRTSTREPFLLLQRGDGQPEVMFYEHRLNYQGLGSGLQPSRAANLLALGERLRALAPSAPLDERMLRPGFLAGLPPLAKDPADLAIFLVSEAWARGC